MAGFMFASSMLHVRDGIEALKLLRGDRSYPLIKAPCISLLEINMPRMNDLEFLRELRQDPSLTHNVVFMLTISTNPQAKNAAYEQHVAGYMLKQHVRADFANAIRLLNDYQSVVIL